MAGIYFHIPFCKVRCSYCDFYKTTEVNKINDFVLAMKLELWLQRDYLNDSTIQSIYFGGGTPSLLSSFQLQELLMLCYSVFKIDENVEITIEANPDDLSHEYLNSLLNIGFNRISIGIQSMAVSDLKLMKRRHNPLQAENAVKFAKNAGFKNISVDLIYGFPGMSFQQWKNNLNEIFSWDVQHISAYHLTYHEGTKIWNDLKNNKICEIEEKESIEQFEELIKIADSNNYSHYEISNFAKEGFYSMHNSSYWKQEAYLGLGPSAHSFNRTSRQWNVASLTHYILALNLRKVPFEIEQLSKNDCFNDYLITSLRTNWGTDLIYIEKEFGSIYVDQLLKQCKKYIDFSQIIKKNNTLILTKAGMFISDTIMADLLITS